MTNDRMTDGRLPSFVIRHSSFRYCRRLTRRAHSSFPLAFRVLPRAKRDAMTALYAFCRASDDLADEPGDPAAKRAALHGWRTRLRDALRRGIYTHRLHAALHDAVHRYEVPSDYLEAVLDGVETDVVPVGFATFDELYPYCYRVASAVGVACLYVWGTRDPDDLGPAIDLATDAGIAFQLTNILRDLGEDRARGRVYLPRDELERFGCPPESWRPDNPAFRELMRFQVGRAREYYAKAARGLPKADAGRLVAAEIMGAIYRRILDRIEDRDYDVFSSVVRIPRPRRALIAASTWARTLVLP